MEENINNNLSATDQSGSRATTIGISNQAQLTLSSADEQQSKLNESQESEEGLIGIKDEERAQNNAIKQSTNPPADHIEIENSNEEQAVGVVKQQAAALKEVSKVKMKANAESPVLKSQDIFGAVKIKDGLFLGDQYSPQDLEFLAVNKISHIVNCAGRQLQNQWTQVGVKYLTFYWLDDDRQLLFDDNDQVAVEILNFIEEATEEHYGVLVHSIRGQSRACCVICIYLMMKHNWSLLKALEFINSRRPNLEIRAQFLQQLAQWQQRRVRAGNARASETWDRINYELNMPLQKLEEVILRNTFMNAQLVMTSEPSLAIESSGENTIEVNDRIKKRSLKWKSQLTESSQFPLPQAKKTGPYSIEKQHGGASISKLQSQPNHRKKFTGRSILKKQRPSTPLSAPKSSETQKQEQGTKKEEKKPDQQSKESKQKTPQKVSLRQDLTQRKPVRNSPKNVQKVNNDRLKQPNNSSTAESQKEVVDIFNEAASPQDQKKVKEMNIDRSEVRDITPSFASQPHPSQDTEVKSGVASVEPQKMQALTIQEKHLQIEHKNQQKSQIGQQSLARSSPSIKSQNFVRPNSSRGRKKSNPGAQNLVEQQMNRPVSRGKQDKKERQDQESGHQKQKSSDTNEALVDSNSVSKKFGQVVPSTQKTQNKLIIPSEPQIGSKQLNKPSSPSESQQQNLFNGRRSSLTFFDADELINNPQKIQKQGPFSQHQSQSVAKQLLQQSQEEKKDEQSLSGQNQNQKTGDKQMNNRKGKQNGGQSQFVIRTQQKEMQGKSANIIAEGKNSHKFFHEKSKMTPHVQDQTEIASELVSQESKKVQQMTNSEILKARGNNFNRDSQLTPLSIPLVKRKVQSQVPSPTIQKSESQTNSQNQNQKNLNAQKKSQDGGNQLTNLLINQPFENKSELKKLISSRQSRRRQLGSARVRSVGHSQGSQEKKMIDQIDQAPNSNNPHLFFQDKAISKSKGGSRYSLDIQQPRKQSPQSAISRKKSTTTGSGKVTPQAFPPRQIHSSRQQNQQKQINPQNQQKVANLPAQNSNTNNQGGGALGRRTQSLADLSLQKHLLSKKEGGSGLHEFRQKNAWILNTNQTKQSQGINQQNTNQIIKPKSGAKRPDSERQSQNQISISSKGRFSEVAQNMGVLSSHPQKLHLAFKANPTLIRESGQINLQQRGAGINPQQQKIDTQNSGIPTQQLIIGTQQVSSQSTRHLHQFNQGLMVQAPPATQKVVLEAQTKKSQQIIASLRRSNSQVSIPGTLSNNNIVKQGQQFSQQNTMPTSTKTKSKSGYSTPVGIPDNLQHSDITANAGNNLIKQQPSVEIKASSSIGFHMKNRIQKVKEPIGLLASKKVIAPSKSQMFVGLQQSGQASGQSDIISSSKGFKAQIPIQGKPLKQNLNQQSRLQPQEIRTAPLNGLDSESVTKALDQILKAKQARGQQSQDNLNRPQITTQMRSNPQELAKILARMSSQQAASQSQSTLNVQQNQGQYQTSALKVSSHNGGGAKPISQHNSSRRQTFSGMNKKSPLNSDGQNQSAGGGRKHLKNSSTSRKSSVGADIIKNFDHKSILGPGFLDKSNI